MLYFEDWSTATLDKSELLFNHQLAPSTISYDNSGRFATVTFHVGVSQINIPYSISNDQIVEGSEYVDFKIVGANSSSGSTTINNDRIRIRIDDDDGNVFMPHVGIYPGITVDEGNPTRSFLVLSEAVSHNVTLRVSTNHNNYREANYPAPNDYQAISNLTIMIPAGNDFVWVPVLTHHNDDPDDAIHERFELCIDAGSVAGAIVNVSCATLTIRDIPKPQPVNISSIIFGNALGGGWEDSSWGVSMNFGAVSYAGAHGVEANFTYPWAGLSFSANGFNTSGYDTLSFAIKGSNSNNGAKVLVVVYLDDGRVKNVPLNYYIPNGVLTPNEWRVVHIPLQHLGAKNTLINQVVFENGATGTLFIDELSFLTDTGVCQ